jgi:hypothetical protein
MEKRGAVVPPRAMGSLDPSDAREAFLDSLDPQEQVRVLRHAERVGPLPDDGDWLVAYGAVQAAARIESAAAKVETAAARVEAAAAACQAQTKNRMQQAPRESSRGASHSTCGVLWAFALSLSAFSLVAYFVERFSSAHLQVIVLYCAALAVGVSASAFYAWFSPRFIRW